MEWYSRKKNPPKRYLAAISIKQFDRHLAQPLRRALKNAEVATNPVERAKCFYEIQTMRELGTKDDQIMIGVYLKNSVSTYIEYINKAIADINIAAPGLHLYITDEDNADITIDENADGCSTRGIFKEHAYVQLDPTWEKDWKGQTTIHELLHALGFEHEFLRKDAETYVTINTEDEQYKDKNDYLKIRGLTRFDPFSVMMYPEDSNMHRNKHGNLVWESKSGTLPNKEMSELDKVALNMVFQPCKGPHYNPDISGDTGMMYCGRNVMSGNQHPFATFTDGRCGPNNWANCPACRVLITDQKYKEMHDVGKWQGWSGLFYCGEKISGSNGKVCGPDTGLPCNQCGRALYAKYDYSKEI